MLLHPGGGGTGRLLRDRAHLDWVRAQRRKVPLLTSVCTGLLVYAAAGRARQVRRGIQYDAQPPV